VTSWQSMTLSLPTATEGGRKVNQMTSKFISRNLQMIDNPLPDQIMEQKQRDFEDEQFKEYAYNEAKELCEEHSVWNEFRSSFQEWYHDYLSDPKNQDPNDMVDKKHLIDDWWEEHGDDLIEDKWGELGNSGPYEIDPTPQHLYDDTGGEPPISAEERRDAEFRKKYGWA